MIANPKRNGFTFAEGAGPLEITNRTNPITAMVKTAHANVPKHTSPDPWHTSQGVVSNAPALNAAHQAPDALSETSFLRMLATELALEVEAVLGNGGDPGSTSTGTSSTTSLATSLATALATSVDSEMTSSGQGPLSGQWTATAFPAGTVPTAGWLESSSTAGVSPAASPTPSAPTTPVSLSSIESAIQGAANEFGVPAELVRAVANQESHLTNTAVSSVGANGVMQLMPSTAKALGVTDPFDVTQNVRAGTKYLKNLLQQFHGNLPLALAAYNAGPGAVQRYGGIPPYPETQTYVRNILAAYEQNLHTSSSS